MRVSWLTAFLDLPASSYERAVQFWCAATALTVSASRGEQQEFATLLAVGSDDYLRLQRISDGDPRIHLDLHTDDPRAVGERAVGLGATELSGYDYTTYRSPGGILFYAVRQPCTVLPHPVRWGDHESLIDQVRIDIPAGLFDAEVTFWAGLLETTFDIVESEDFVQLARIDGHPLQLLLHRMDPDDGAEQARALLDMATTDLAAESRRLVSHGAKVTTQFPSWALLTGPGGMDFCVTQRVPAGV